MSHPSPEPSPPTAKTSWNPPIPLNFHTAVFCFLMGAVFSVPVGMLPSRFLLFEPPESLIRLYPMVVAVCYFLLPFWCVFAVRKYPPLPVLGTVTFASRVVVALFFPAVTT